jgi:predicted nucleotidyltransferase component of viral defense system
MKKEVKNLSASVQDRLRNKARKSGLLTEWVYRYYADERFLYRLAQSEYHQKFVLKGGLTFIGWGMPLRRHTKDIDFRAYIRDNIEEVIKIIKDVCIQPVEPDGIEFLADSVIAEEIIEEAEYPGIRVHLWAQLGETNKIRLQLDMGFSDEIVPPATTISYPTALPEMPAPIIQGYPKEAVIAEKLHCLVDRGRINSRMKDFYDIWYIIMQCNIDGVILQEAIINTFTNRETSIPNDLPVGLSDDFAQEKKEDWRAFLNSFNPELPEVNDFNYIIHTLRDFFVPVLKAIFDGKTFELKWNAGKEWLAS